MTKEAREVRIKILEDERTRLINERYRINKRIEDVEFSISYLEHESDQEICEACQ